MFHKIWNITVLPSQNIACPQEIARIDWVSFFPSSCSILMWWSPREKDAISTIKYPNCHSNKCNLAFRWTFPNNYHVRTNIHEGKKSCLRASLRHEIWYIMGFIIPIWISHPQAINHKKKIISFLPTRKLMENPLHLELQKWRWNEIWSWKAL